MIKACSPAANHLCRWSIPGAAGSSCAELVDRRLIRCGPLNEATTARIQSLPLEQLEALAEALLDFQGPDDLTAWLASGR